MHIGWIVSKHWQTNGRTVVKQPAAVACSLSGLQANTLLKRSCAVVGAAHYRCFAGQIGILLPAIHTRTKHALFASSSVHIPQSLHPPLVEYKIWAIKMRSHQMLHNNGALRRVSDWHFIRQRLRICFYKRISKIKSNNKLLTTTNCMQKQTGDGVALAAAANGRA